jgi:hypothetical protein
MNARRALEQNINYLQLKRIKTEGSNFKPVDYQEANVKSQIAS